MRHTDIRFGPCQGNLHHTRGLQHLAHRSPLSQERHLPLFQPWRMLLVRLHPDDTTDGQHALPLGRNPAPLRHPSLPEQPVPLAREASLLLRPGQDKDTGSLPSGHPLLDRLPQAVHRKPIEVNSLKTLKTLKSLRSLKKHKI